MGSQSTDNKHELAHRPTTNKIQSLANTALALGLLLQIKTYSYLDHIE